MSGGSLDYFYSSLEAHIGDFKDKELDDLVCDLAQLFHDREWYLSGDTCEGDWREARDSFKEKWFTEHGRQDRIEQYLKETVMEIKEAFGIEQHYCRSCKHWTAKDDSECYGRCEYISGCLMHRNENCSKYERRCL